MKIEFGPYNTGTINVIKGHLDGDGVLVYPSAINPFREWEAECFRNNSNQVVISYVEHSNLYSATEWQELLADRSLQIANETQMDLVLDDAKASLKMFLENELENRGIETGKINFSPNAKTPLSNNYTKPQIDLPLNEPNREADTNRIRNCSWGFSCTQTWRSLSETDFERVRFCTDCDRRVIKCLTKEHLLKHIEANNCVCFPKGLISDGSVEGVDYFEGIPF